MIVFQLDPSNDENRKVNLAPIVARRIFSEQVNEIVSLYSRRKGIRVPLPDVLNLFRNKYGYSMIPQTLGCNTIDEMMRCLPFIEVSHQEIPRRSSSSVITSPSFPDQRIRKGLFHHLPRSG